MNVETVKNINIALSSANQLEVKATKVILPEAIQLCYAAIEVLCKSSLAQAKDEKLIAALKEDMFEMINLGASSVLDRLFPDIVARPDLTVDAIMKAENELLEKDGKKYVDAYNESVQSDIDIAEHEQIKKNLSKSSKSKKKEG